ncbi:MAG: ABC transporter permease [Verrucomicrobia bacterium]|nr:ABC transporter permease [Verrucomicrobiota bacterium]
MTARQQLPEAGTELRTATAKLETGQSGSECLVKVGGDWRLSEPVPSWTGVLGEKTATSMRVVPEGLGKWDTTLVLFLVHGQAWCAKSKKDFHVEALPKNLQALLRQVAGISEPKPMAKTDVKSTWGLAGDMAKMWASHAMEMVSFIGECTLGFMDAAKKPRQFRWMDCLFEMQQCWATSLPIVSVVSFLVGVILAFQAAIQLRQFGAAIFVADLVGLAVVREMGPMMAAVIVAGGTGAGFAAQLGNMKVGEEIDALETLGVSAVDFLALPRLLAVTLMMPVLAAYANVLGVLGGMFVSATMLDIPAAAYWIETQASVGVLDVTTGLIKSLFFGLAVGLAGCLRGMKCERSAAGVGAATSSAVVTGVMLIILADALFGTIFNVLRI